MGIFSKIKKLKTINNEDVSFINGERVFVVPNDITIIDSNAFSNLNVNTVIINKYVKEINEKAFINNPYIKNIIIDADIKTLRPSTFCNCLNLEYVKLPQNIIRLEQSCFQDCKNLKKIHFNKNLKIIEGYAFKNCPNLDNVIIPNSVVEIGHFCFASCFKLKNIQLPNSLTELSMGLFDTCIGLTSITIPENVKLIRSSCFSHCIKLKNINFPKTLEKIEPIAFSNCNNLEEFKLSTYKMVHLDENLLMFCKQLKSVEIEIISNESVNTIFSLNLSGFKNYSVRFSDEYNKLNSLNNSIEKYIKIPYGFAKLLIRYKQDEIFKKSNFKFYKRLEKLFATNLDQYDEQTFIIACYNLGVFSENKQFGNKISNFIEEILITNTVSLTTFISMFQKMELKGFNQEYSEFITKKENFTKLLSLYAEGYDIFSEAYNNFEEIQINNVSKNVQHRQLKPTVEKFKNYLTPTIFDGVTEKTQNIANEIAKFSNNQEDFELGVSIIEKYNKMVEKNNFQDIEIEDASIFSVANKIEEEILKLNLESLNDITKTLKKDYSYEWLKKNDPKNLMLGYYCSCCAHIDGSGEGIMIASIIHPDVKNLVIKNEAGKIVSKFTLYINPTQGYGVVNTGSLTTNILDPLEREKVFLTFLKGIKAFVNTYNKNHPENKIKQINIGGKYNKFTNIFYKYNILKEENLLKGLNFKKFSENYEYKGDWQDEQYCIFKLEEENEKLL